MRGLSLAGVLGMVVVGLSIAAEPERMLPGPGGGEPVGIEREVLWLDAPAFDWYVASSEVIGAYDLWTEVAGNFLLEAEATICKVTWWGVYWNGFEGPTGAGFNLRFYMDIACLPEDAPFSEYLLPGDDCCEALAEGGDMYMQFVYEYCLDLPLPPGSYWFSAQMADHEFPPQWGRLGARWNNQPCESMWRSPFFGYPDWTGDPTGLLYPWWGSQMIEDVCEATLIEKVSWGNIKTLYRAQAR